jgi:hypothetical protein
MQTLTVNTSLRTWKRSSNAGAATWGVWQEERLITRQRNMPQASGWRHIADFSDRFRGILTLNVDSVSTVQNVTALLFVERGPGATHQRIFALGMITGQAQLFTEFVGGRISLWLRRSTGGVSYNARLRALEIMQGEIIWEPPLVEAPDPDNAGATIMVPMTQPNNPVPLPLVDDVRMAQRLPSSPHLWPTNGVEVDLGDGTFGVRRSQLSNGASSRISGTNIHAALAPVGTRLEMIEKDGYWRDVNGEDHAVGGTAYGISGPPTTAAFTTMGSAIITVNSGRGFRFDLYNLGGMGDTVPANRPFDVWVRYRKV